MIDAMRALLADRLAVGVRWRHHGIGVLQAYLREHAEPEVRVHVWHPLLVRRGIYESGSIHDHRFDLESTVVVGTLHERVFEIDASHEGDCRWQIWHVENARSAGEARGFDGECVPLSSQRYVANITTRTHPAGTTYRLKRGVFHETRIDALAITVCAMHRKAGSARLLVPYGHEPVHAFGSSIPSDVIGAVLSEALAALGGARG